MDPLTRATRIAGSLFWLAIMLLILLSAFGCAVPPPVEHKPMFSTTPPAEEQARQARRQARKEWVERMLKTMDPPDVVEPYLPGEPVFVSVVACDDAAVKRVKTAVKLAVALHRALVVDFDGPGGRVVAGWAIIEALQDPRLLAVRCSIKTEADSMNAFAFAGAPCTSRSLYSTSRLVFHHPAVDVLPTDTWVDLERKAGVAEAIAKALCGGVAAHSRGRISPELCHWQLHQNVGRTWTLTGKEVLDAGLADFFLDVK